MAGKSKVWVDRKLAQSEAAYFVGESEALEVVARRVYNYARKEATYHIDTQDYFETIEMEHMPPNKWGVRDWEIFTDDWASYHIEVGHYAPDKGAPGATWVEGQNIFKKAVADLRGEWIESKKR